MHGLINRSIEHFLIACYGAAFWQELARHTGVPRFEAMLTYDDALTDQLIALAAEALDKPVPMVLEDLGAHLARTESLRRLLRFGGNDFCEFLLSLNELRDRGRLAVPELELPVLQVSEGGPGLFRIYVEAEHSGWAYVLCGLLCAMGDDYGALVLLDDPVFLTDDAVRGRCRARIGVEVIHARYAEGRQFRLAERSP